MLSTTPSLLQPFQLSLLLLLLLSNYYNNYSVIIVSIIIIIFIIIIESLKIKPSADSLKEGRKFRSGETRIKNEEASDEQKQEAIFLGDDDDKVRDYEPTYH